MPKTIGCLFPPTVAWLFTTTPLLLFNSLYHNSHLFDLFESLCIELRTFYDFNVFLDITYLDVERTHTP